MDNLKALKDWLLKVEEIAKNLGLEFVPQEFVICNNEQMVERQAHHGGYNLYPHWSFGKAKFITRILYDHRFSFLPNEIVINTNPCTAFMLETNPIVDNIMIGGHVYAHNDFFNRNVAFRLNRPELIQTKLKRGSQLIQRCVENPKFGSSRVEKLIDAAHGAFFLFDEHGNHFIDFAIRNFRNLSAIDQEILEVIKALAIHLWPIAETKIMNEGWASYWHFRTLRLLSDKLIETFGADAYHEAIKMHLRVIKMPRSFLDINPYRIGFYTWNKARKELGSEKELFRVRKNYTDEEFLEEFFNNKDGFIHENFIKPFIVENASKRIFVESQLRQMADQYRDNVLKARADKLYPKFDFAIEPLGLVQCLVLRHIFDGRVLDSEMAQGTMKLIHYIWKGPIRLETKSISKRRQHGKYITKDKIIVCNQLGDVEERE
ncbi:MAG: SpoVR family protein [Patescibacteria group bacterium]